jgi:Tfp pilus assembly pilus retraction ATPase PilT
MSSPEPSSPGDAGNREHLASLSKALLALHKTLLESERIGYEESFGKIATPAAFFQLVMGDPWFAWLRTLSEFIVLIDERLDEKNHPVTGEDVAEFFGRARALLTPQEDGAGFALHYHNAMQRDPDVILAHAGMVKRLNSLQNN